MKFVLDSGIARTIVPKVATPGMELRKSNGGSFRAEIGEVIPNLACSTLEGTDTLNRSPSKMCAQVAEITRLLAAVDEMVESEMMVIMQRSCGIAKRINVDTEGKMRDLLEIEKRE